MRNCLTCDLCIREPEVPYQVFQYAGSESGFPMWILPCPCSLFPQDLPHGLEVRAVTDCEDWRSGAVA